MTDRARRIRVLARNSSTTFDHTFGDPDEVMKFLKGWLHSPDRPYELTITEKGRRTKAIKRDDP